MITFYFVFLRQGLMWTCWPGTCYVDQADCKLKRSAASASQGLKECTIMPDSHTYFYFL